MQVRRRMGSARRMRRLAAAVAVAGLAAAPATSSWEPVAGGGWVSGDVEHVGNVLLEAGTASDATLHEERLYVTTWRSFSIYDVTRPEQPRRLSTTPLPGAFFNEEPQTDGDILLISRDAQYVPRTDAADLGRYGGAVLEIYDVRTPETPTRLATWRNERSGFLGIGTRRDHIWTCVLDCDYAYSAGGTILDLRDPANPVKVGDWTEKAPFRGGRMHHVTEVAPGIVLTGSLPMYVLDARREPARPDVLAEIEPNTTEPALVTEPVEVPNLVANPEGLPARADWPGGLQGQLAVVAMETPFAGPCQEHAGDVQTFRTDGWREHGFRPADRYQLAENGLYADGAPPYNAVGCSAYGMQVHPTFSSKKGGAVAVAFFEHGVRVLDVDDDGRLTEIGGWVPAAGNSTAPVWADDEILYVVDLHRGIDILRVAGAGGS